MCCLKFQGWHKRHFEKLVPPIRLYGLTIHPFSLISNAGYKGRQEKYSNANLHSTILWSARRGQWCYISKTATEYHNTVSIHFHPETRSPVQRWYDYLISLKNGNGYILRKIIPTCGTEIVEITYLRQSTKRTSQNIMTSFPKAIQFK
jgi:hypothetical protein